MVRKIFDFLYKETSTLNQAAFLLGIFAFLSQILAFLRDRLLAHIFGASGDLDIYYAAFRIPDFIFVTVASIVSISVLVPFIIEKEMEGESALKDFINNIFSFFSLLIIVVSVAAFFLMPALSGFLFKGFSENALTEAILVSRILLLSPILLGFSNLFGSLTQAFNRFAIYALAPILYNTGIIFGTLFLSEKYGVKGVATGVIAGALLHALVQVPFVVKSNLFPRFSFRFDSSLILKVAKISLPRTLTLSMSSIAFIFLTALASVMISGSISILSFSNNLQSIPLSIIGVSYSLAAFPILSKRFRENNLEAFTKQMASTARFIIFWSLPVTALFIVLRAQIVRVVLGSGLFDWNDTRLTAAVFALFMISSMFQSLLLLFMRGFYSAGLTSKPFYINLIATILLFVGTWGLVEFFNFSEYFRFFIGDMFKVEDLPGTSVLMLPLGFSLATIINCLIHWFAFEQKFKGFSVHVAKTFFDSLGASVVIGASTYVGLNIFAEFFQTDSLLLIFLQGLTAGVLGIVTGIIVLMLLGNVELDEVRNTFRKKFWKAKVIATDPEIV